MAKPRLSQTPHRPRREEARTHEVQSLRGENNSLKKQVARLRKQLGKTEPVEVADPEPRAKKIEPALSCKDCASTDVGSVKLPLKTLYVCRPCGAKWNVLK